METIRNLLLPFSLARVMPACLTPARIYTVPAPINLPACSATTG